MKTSNLLSSRPLPPCSYRPRFRLHFNFLRFSPVGRASSSPPPLSSSQGIYRGVKPQRGWLEEWVSENDGFVRIMPILVGGISLVAVLLNRAFSGIAPVADASRFWESLSTATCCKSLVVVLENDCLLQIGAAAKQSDGDDNAETVDIIKLIKDLFTKVACNLQNAGTKADLGESYLANLSLYPGRTELPFLPTNTQALILQPIGDRGIAIIGGDTIRGFTATDQAWISMFAEKLDASLSKFIEARAPA